jgi:hypothetical protein
MSFKPGMGICPALLFLQIPAYTASMKATLYLWLPALLVLGACGEKSDTPVASTNSTANANGYLGALVKDQQAAVKTIDTTSLDQAIQLFSVQNGRNPKDLNELVEQKFIPKIPETPFGTKLVYDASAGTVKIVNK